MVGMFEFWVWIALQLAATVACLVYSRIASRGQRRFWEMAFWSGLASGFAVPVMRTLYGFVLSLSGQSYGLGESLGALALNLLSILSPARLLGPIPQVFSGEMPPLYVFARSLDAVGLVMGLVFGLKALKNRRFWSKDEESRGGAAS